MCVVFQFCQMLHAHIIRRSCAKLCKHKLHALASQHDLQLQLMCEVLLAYTVFSCCTQLHSGFAFNVSCVVSLIYNSCGISFMWCQHELQLQHMLVINMY